MQEIIDQLLSYLKGIWIKKWLALLVAWIICIIAWPIVLKMPDEYQARAQVYVDTDSLLKPLLRGIALQTNPSQQISLMVKTLMTRPNLEKIARLTDLDLTAKNPADFDQLILDLRDNIKLSQAGRENLYTIHFSDEDPVLAKKVVQATLTTLVENTLGNKREDSDSAQSFIDQQIEEYERRINETENQLKEFQRRNVGMMSGEQGGFYSRLQGLKMTLTSIQLELKESQARYESIVQQMEGERPTFGLMDTPSSMSSNYTSQYDQRISSLQSELDRLRLKYTDAHPDIKETQRTIDSLQALKDEELEEVRQFQQENPNQSVTGLDQNPVYQELKISLAREKSNLDTLKVRERDYLRRVDELEKKIHTIPEIEAELKELQRGHALNQEKYNQLLSRREAVQISQRAEVSADSFQFRVIDPPRVPTQPSGPNRTLFLSGILVLAVGMGVAVAFLFSQLRPVFFSTRELNAVTGFPVLGSVSMLHSRQVIRATRRKAFLFIFLAFALLGLYALLIGLQLNPELNAKIASILPDVSSSIDGADTIINKIKGLL